MDLLKFDHSAGRALADMETAMLSHLGPPIPVQKHRLNNLSDQILKVSLRHDF